MDVGKREDRLLDFIAQLIRDRTDQRDYLRTVLTVIAHNAPAEVAAAIRHLLAEI